MNSIQGQLDLGEEPGSVDPVHVLATAALAQEPESPESLPHARPDAADAGIRTEVPAEISRENGSQGESERLRGFLGNPLVRKVLGENLVKHLWRLCTQLTIAGSVISEYVQQYPAHAQACERSCIRMRWSLRVWPGDELFRAHVRELLQRLVEGQSLTQGTAAEVLTQLLKDGCERDLDPAPLALTVRLFDQLCGRALPDGVRAEVPVVDAAAMDEVLVSMRAQLAQAWRGSESPTEADAAA